MEKNLKIGKIIAFIKETKHLKLKEMTGLESYDVKIKIM